MNAPLIQYGFHATPFGGCLIALRNEAICYLVFSDNREQSLTELQSLWPHETFVENQDQTKKQLELFFSAPADHSYQLHLEGTEFQKTVWHALTTIKSGTTVSYTDVAAAIGKPTAVRAVASAIARNNISLFIPCHRVITSSGKTHKYRWGSDRKKAILAWEKTR